MINHMIIFDRDRVLNKIKIYKDLKKYFMLFKILRQIIPKILHKNFTNLNFTNFNSVDIRWKSSKFPTCSVNYKTLIAIVLKRISI